MIVPGGFTVIKEKAVVDRSGKVVAMGAKVRGINGEPSERRFEEKAVIGGEIVSSLDFRKVDGSVRTEE